MKCPICKMSGVIEEKEALICPDCRSVRTIHHYDASLYGEWYSDHFAENAQTDIAFRIYLYRLGLIARWMPKDGRLLDFGCCNGDWLRYVQRFYNCLGVEPNPWALARAKKSLGQSRVVGSLDKLREESSILPPYDMVTMFDVIEHIEYPEELFTKLVQKILKKGGYLVVCTPSLDAVRLSDTHSGPFVDLILGGPENKPPLQEWKHWKPKEHLFLYSAFALNKLAKTFGFRLVHSETVESEIRPDNPNGDVMTSVFCLG